MQVYYTEWTGNEQATTNEYAIDYDGNCYTLSWNGEEIGSAYKAGDLIDGLALVSREAAQYFRAYFDGHGYPDGGNIRE